MNGLRLLFCVLFLGACVGAEDEPTIVVDTTSGGKSDSASPTDNAKSSTNNGMSSTNNSASCEPIICHDACGVVTNGCGDSVDCGVCVDEERVDQLTVLVDGYIDRVTDVTYATAIGFDPQRVRDEVREIIRDYAASDAGYIAAVRHVMLSSNIGHAGFYDVSDWTCTDIDGASDGSLSRFGACGVAHPDGVLVTNVAAANPLGLRAGDIVAAVNGLGGDALVDWSLRRPICGEGAASERAKREEAARSFFSALAEGTELQVQSPDGSTRLAEAPGPLSTAQWMYCRDALGRPTDQVVSAYLRPDGVGVIRLTSFLPPGGFDPTGTLAEQQRAFEDAVFERFEDVREADALVWDVRSNVGGLSRGGLTIVGGMPGASETLVTRCTTRIEGTEPAEYQATGPDYDLTPHQRFAFDGPVAVLIDGRTASAGDYFALAAHLGTDAILVGSQTAGAFGGSGPLVPLGDELGLSASFDSARCNDAEGRPLEGRGVVPHIEVEYDPRDLANEVDTVLERAVDELLHRP